MSLHFQNLYRHFTRHRSEWRDLRTTLVARSSLLVIGASWVTWFVMLARYSYQLDLVLILAGLLLISAITLFQARRHPIAAAGTLSTAVFMVVAVAYVWFDIPLAGFAFVIPVIMVTSLLHPAMSLLVVLLSAGILFLFSPSTYPDAWTIPAALVLFVGLFDALAGMGLFRELNLVWDYSAEEAARAEEARQQRAEVSRLNRALNLANSLLERSNNELATARREAEAARHLKEQFATQVSHELRTPLNIILGFLEVMQRYPEVYGEVRWTPALRQDIAEIQGSARYLSDLVDDILDLARIEAMKMPVRRTMTDLAEVVGEVRELAEQLMRDRPIRLVVQVLPVPTLFLDRTRIRQILLNLLANASRFTEQGQIGITVQQEEEEVVISVSDTGAGMQPEQLAHLFTEFYQAPDDVMLPASPRPFARTSPSARGKGLGLVIAKQFVELHGGRIWAESQPGVGSSFHFTLPLVSKEAGGFAYSEPVGPKPTGLPRSLLVVDREAATYLRRRLEGYHIMTARSPAQVEELVDTYHPDAVLYSMPLPTNVTSAPSAELLSWGMPVLQCPLPLRSWMIEDEMFDDWLVKPVSTQQIVELFEKHASARHILVVDDDASFVQFVRRVLEATQGQDAEWHVVQAPDSTTALECARNGSVDLVLLDMGLPDADGRTVARALRAFPGEPVPIVVISARTPEEEQATGQLGSFGVTRQTGFGEDELLSLITQTLSIVKPHYATQPPDPGPAAVPSATPAS